MYGSVMNTTTPAIHSTPGVATLAADLDRLLAEPAWPSVSVLLSADRTEWPALLDEARSRLLDVLDREELELLLTDLVRAERDFDAGGWPSIGVYANEHLACAVALPQPVAARVVVDATFATRDLVAGLARTPAYLVLAIDGHEARLWDGLGSHLVAAPGPFPLRFPDEPASSERQHFQERSRRRDAQMDRTIRFVDEALAQVLDHDRRRPMFVVGSARRVARFAESTAHGAHVDATIVADPTSAPVDLAALVAPHLLAAQRADAADALDAVGSAIGINRFAGGVAEVWPLAMDGRVELLVVEDEYRQAGELDAVGQLALRPDPATAAIDDVVDELIELVIATGGRVRPVPADALEAWGRVAARLRH